MSNKSNTRTKKAITVISILIVILLALSGCALLPTEREPLPPPLVEPPQIRFNLHTVEMGDIVHQVIGAATFVPIREYNLSFLNNSGRLHELHATPGMNVEKGDLLAELESESIKFEIAQMETDLTEMLLVRDKLEMDFDKMTDTLQELNRAYRSDPSDINKNAVENLRHQIAKFEIDIKIHDLNIKQHERNLQRVKDRLEATRIVSPIDGLIVFVARAAIGDWINAYQHLITVADPSVMYLRYSPAVTTGFANGMNVIVDIEDTEYSGIIVMTPLEDAELDVQNPRFEDSIIIKVDNLPETVRPGDDASIRIIFQEKRDVITIPRSGLRTMGARNFVVVRSNDVSREVDVEIGIETPTLIEIVSGLNEGDQIILR